MAFNIQEFQSQVTSSGYAETSTFIVDITPPPTLIGGEVDGIFRFYCRSVGLPEFDIQVADVPIQGFGAPTKKPIGRTFPIIPATFLVDKNHSMLGFFHRWSQLVSNYDRSAGPLGSAFGMTPFEINYKSEYQGTMSIVVFNRQAGTTYVYELGGVFPQNVGSVDMAWDSENLMLLPVGFAFDTIRVSGAVGPTITGDRGGANSLLTYFSSLNSYVKAFQSIRRPSDVQNLVNQTAAVIDNIFG